jgi:hypothetical protein
MSLKARMRVNERMICVDGIEPATEAFGYPAHPPVLLIMDALCRPCFGGRRSSGNRSNRGRRTIWTRYTVSRSRVPGLSDSLCRSTRGPVDRRTIEPENRCKKIHGCAESEIRRQPSTRNLIARYPIPTARHASRPLPRFIATIGYRTLAQFPAGDLSRR